MTDILKLSHPFRWLGRHHLTHTDLIRLERALLLLWFVLNLGVGALTVHEYGMSVDEPNNYRYADDTLAAYPSLFGIRYEPNYDSSYEGHGPAFVTLASIPIKIIENVFPNVFVPDLWHFSYFITFQLTGLCLYWLARRWFDRGTAWGLLILFGTQPLLLGHAFINPKDIPFMFFLTFSIVAGFRMADAMESQEPFVSLETPVRTVVHRFRETDPRRKKIFLICLVLVLTLAFGLVVFSHQVNSLIGQVITFFYTAEADSWAGHVFAAAANPDVPVNSYVTKALKIFHRLERGLLVAGVLFFLAYFGLLINSLTLSSFLRDAWRQRYRLGRIVSDARKRLQSSLRPGLFKFWFTEIFRALSNPRVILAGVALGLATGVRAIAPVAGLIVVLYLLAKVRSRGWTTAIAYFLVAGIVTYVAWPHLWGAPVRRYFEALGVASNFPNYEGRVLFDGNLYGPTDLPHSYLPTLLSLQFTEPLVLCIYVGLGLLAWRVLRSRLRTDLLLYIGLGFAFPLLALILLNSPLYNNFRQVLFLIPAMAMLGASTLEPVFSKMPQVWMRLLLIAVLALPGVYSNIKLYPYQYVYYNSLVGGPAGAVNRYELDYWRISLREMALELNEVARPGAIIVVTRSAGLLARYARPDLIIDKTVNSTLDLTKGYDYIVQVTRWERFDLYREVGDLIVIERDGTVLVTAKDVKDVSRAR